MRAGDFGLDARWHAGAADDEGEVGVLDVGEGFSGWEAVGAHVVAVVGGEDYC